LEGRLADQTGKPALREIVSGPRIEGADTRSFTLDRSTLHSVFGLPVNHGPVGATNLVADNFPRPTNLVAAYLSSRPGFVSGHVITHETPGDGASIVKARALAWFALPGAANPKAPNHVASHDGYQVITTSFLVRFDEQTFTGWQAKFGFGPEGYQSGRQFPGGGHQYDPDWVCRPHWNHYPVDPNNLAKGRQPLRFGNYIYSGAFDTRHLDGQVWQTKVQGGGQRRLVLFNDGPTPEPEKWYRYTTRIEDGPNDEDERWRKISIAIHPADEPEQVVWSEVVGLEARANRVVLSSAFGGSHPREGPTHDAQVEYSRLSVEVAPRDDVPSV
jgi:hypothetical protein